MHLKLFQFRMWPLFLVGLIERCGDVQLAGVCMFVLAKEGL